MNIPTEMSLAGITLKDPMMTVSGTFGADEEYSEFMDLNKLNAVVTKGVVAAPWADNLTPRFMETPSDMLNAIGLQNSGVDAFLGRDLFFLKRFDTRVVTNVYGHGEEEYVEVVERLHKASVDFLEFNVSYPSVKEGGIAFGTQARAVEHITRRVKKRTTQPLTVKFSLDITDITETVHAAKAGSMDVFSLINILTGMRIDIMRRSFVLVNRTGGFSGLAVHLITVCMAYNCAHVVKLPLVGMGGTSVVADTVEMIFAGMTVVSAGIANFHNPRVSEEVATRIAAYLKQTRTEDIREPIGAVR